MCASPDRRAPEPLDAQAALAELGRLSFAETSMDAMLLRIAELAKQVTPGVAEASVTVVTGRKASTAAFTGPLAMDLDDSQYSHGHGPCVAAAVGQEIQEISDARSETRWPGHARDCVDRGALSSLSVPVPVRETVHAALNLYAHQAHAFDAAARQVAAEFASYAAIAMQNRQLYESSRELAEHLDTAMRTRAVIEQAKGILMSQRHCDAAEAFNLLAGASQRSNRKLHDIAQVIVDGVSGRTGHPGA
jgi:GAF domain-containing protein